MLSKKRKGIVVAALIVLGILCCGCNEKPSNTQAREHKIEEAMDPYIEIAIPGINDTEGNETIADVQITMPDIKKIYTDIAKQGTAADMTLDDIEAAIMEYAKDEEYLINETVTTAVTKSGAEWVLESDDCVDEMMMRQINAMLAAKFSEIGTIELEGGLE